MLKDELCNAPTLIHPDFTKKFILHYNGSKECGYGAVLHQKDNEGIEQPILYLAKWMWYPEGIPLPFPEEVMLVLRMQDPAVVARFLAHFLHYFIPGIG